MPEFIMVPVPPERVNDVYALLAGRGGVASASDPSVPVEEKEEVEEGHEPWDEESLRRFYKESSPNMQVFLRLLAERWPETVTSTEAGKDLPKGAQSVAGMLGAAARRAWNHHDRVLPWESWWQPTDDRGGTETVFKMPEEVAKLIRSIS